MIFLFKTMRNLILNLFCCFQFVFEGVVGKSYKGDIGLDDITVNDGQCPPTGKTMVTL